MTNHNATVDTDRLRLVTEIAIRGHLQTATELIDLLDLPVEEKSKFLAAIVAALESLPTKKS